MVDMRHCFKRNGQILRKESKEGPVLIDPYRRTLIQLNPTALEIWQLVDGTRSVMEIIEAMRDVFEADEEVLRKDIAGFLEDMMKREMIR